MFNISGVLFVPDLNYFGCVNLHIIVLKEQCSPTCFDKFALKMTLKNEHVSQLGSGSQDQRLCWASSTHAFVVDKKKHEKSTVKREDGLYTIL